MRMDWERTGADASLGVVEGAVLLAGVRIVRCGATPCRAHLILCLCPETYIKIKAIDTFLY